jgi:acyl-CoA reductase-like NAD-dependent aldehyde dehydrogenase
MTHSEDYEFCYHYHVHQRRRNLRGIVGNAGQMCDASSRLIVHEEPVDEVGEKLYREAASRLGGRFRSGSDSGMEPA